MDAPGWDKGLTVGLAEVDHEHGLQVALIRALENSVNEGTAARRGTGILSQLLDYTEAHFLAEEMLMRLAGAEGYEAHVADHDRLVAQLNDLKTRVEEGKEAVTEATVSNLKERLTVHVRQMDRALPTATAPR